MNTIDEVTGVEDVGFGPVVKLETICKKCSSVTGGSVDGYHSCKICDAWVSDVRYRSVRMFRTDVA